MSSKPVAFLNEPSDQSGLDGTATEYPVSYGQRGFWFLHQLAPNSSVCNIAKAVCIHADLDVDAFRRSFQALVDRHDCLRTTFATREGEPVQRVHERMDVSFHHEDGSNWSESVLQARLNQEAHRPFNLQDGPLMRVNVLTRSAREHIFLLTIHHIVSDFWSLALLLSELGTIYEAEEKGSQAELPPLKLRYADYVRREREMASSSSRT